MTPRTPSPYQIDRYTIEWLQRKRSHWAPDPMEKELDDLLAEGKPKMVLVVLLGCVTGSRRDVEKKYAHCWDFIARITREIMDGTVAIVQEHKTDEESLDEEAAEESKLGVTCVVRTWYPVVFAHVGC